MVNIPLKNEHFDPDVNFWQVNPQFKYYKPYSDLYDQDTEDKKYSSKQMWCIVFLSHPDREKNIFSEMSPGEREKMLKETYGKDLDWENEDFRKCINSFPFDALTAVQRSIQEEKRQLFKRVELIQNTELTLDKTITPEDGRPYVEKGTASQINALQKDSLTVYKRYEEAEKLFIQEKEEIRAKGDQTTSVAEREDFF